MDREIPEPEEIHDALLLLLANHYMWEDIDFEYVAPEKKIPVRTDYHSDIEELLDEIEENRKIYTPPIKPTRSYFRIKEMYVDGIWSVHLHKLIDDDLLHNVLSKYLYDEKFYTLMTIVAHRLGTTAGEILEEYGYLRDGYVEDMMFLFEDEIDTLKRNLLFYMTDTEELVSVLFNMERYRANMDCE